MEGEVTMQRPIRDTSVGTDLLWQVTLRELGFPLLWGNSE